MIRPRAPLESRRGPGAVRSAAMPVGSPAARPAALVVACLLVPGAAALVVACLLVRRTAALVAACLLVPGAAAQRLPEQFTVDRLSIEDGLPVNHVNAVYQTPDGYLWLATFGGLVRYDGLRFTTFTAGNTPGIPSDRLTGIQPGPGNSLFFTTERFDVVRVSPGRFDFLGRLDVQVRGVIPDSDGQYWIGTAGGLYRYEVSGEQATVTRVSDPALEGIAVRELHRDAAGAIWLSDVNSGGVLRQTASGWIPAGRVQGTAPWGPPLYEDRHGTIWAGGSVASRVRGGRLETVPLAGLPVDRPGFQIATFAEDPAGDLLLVTNYGTYRARGASADQRAPLDAPRREATANNVGAIGVCPGGRIWTHSNGVVYGDAQPVAWVGDRILHMLCGTDDTLWIATEGGLYRVRQAEVTNYGTPEGLGVGSATNLLQDRSGAVIVSGIERVYDRLSGARVTTHRHDAFGAPFYQDASGAIWHGTYRCAAERASPDRSCTTFEQVWTGGAGPWVRAIHEDRRGTLWFGMLSGVMWLENGRWGRPTAGEAAPTHPVRHFLETRDGALYMATFGGGVAVRRPGAVEGDGRFTFLTSADGLSSDNVRGLFEDTDGTLWIATEDRGLDHYDPGTGRVTVIRQADGLYSDGLHQILADDFGRFWMSSNQGIFWVRADELRAFVRGDTTGVSSVFYTEQSGMRIREANGGFQNSAMKARDGRVWFATQAGAVVIDPSTVEAHLEPVPVVVEALETGGASAVLAGRNQVDIAAKERTFRISYTAVNFSSPARMRFRYRLDGYDDAWIQAGSRREATYTRVPPGRYVFRVSASHGDGVWNSSAEPVSVTVAPFFYETLLFKGLLAVAGLGLVWLWLGVRTRSVVRRRKELEVEVQERTNELLAEKKRTEEQGEQLLRMDRLKSRFFTNVSHEFRTPLTLTIGPLEDLRADPAFPDSLRDGLDMALSNSRRILRLINQLLDVARLEAGEMRLSASRQDLAGFVEGVADQFVRLLERKGIHSDVQVPKTPIPVWLDGEKMEQVVVNLLSNAFKFTPEGGAIGVTVSSDKSAHPGVARVVVRDTGSGIPPELLPHVFDRFYQVGEASAGLHGSSGIGLSLAHDLVELHGGSITVESTPRFGSTFTITIPLGRDHLDDDQVTRTAPGTRDGEGRVSRIVAALEEESSDADAGPAETDDRFTVLVADDNADIRTYVRRHMEGRYRVLEAADGAEALDLVRRSTPDLVVSDIMMPVLDGLGLVTALRSDRDTDFIPVVMLTAKATEEDLLKGLEVGADAYVTKPFSMRELQLRIDGLISTRQRLRKRYSDPHFERPHGAVTADAPVGLSDADHAFVARVHEVIDEHLSDEDFDVQKLADALRISRNTLHRRLRAVLGVAPSEALRKARLERAAALLAQNEWSVSEVAYAVGFKSVSYFSYCFREEYGVTPSTHSWRAAGPTYSLPAPPRTPST